MSDNSNDKKPPQWPSEALELLAKQTQALEIIAASIQGPSMPRREFYSQRTAQQLAHRIQPFIAPPTIPEVAHTTNFGGFVPATNGHGPEGEDPIPLDVLAAHTLVFGNTGSGKSNTVMRLAERLLAAGERIVVIDPTDVWWGLTKQADGITPAFDIPIYGGDHSPQSLPLDDGSDIGQQLATGNESAIFSLKKSGRRVEGYELFLTDLLSALHSNKTADDGRRLFLVIDEAHLLAPSRTRHKLTEAETGLRDVITDLMTGSRSSGLNIILITQRPVELEKTTRTQVETVIVHRLADADDREAAAEAIGGDNAIRKAIIRDGQNMPAGIAWIRSIEVQDLPPLVQFPLRQTFDSAPTLGKRVRITEKQRGAIMAAVAVAADSEPRPAHPDLVQFSPDSKITDWDKHGLDELQLAMLVATGHDTFAKIAALSEKDLTQLIGDAADDSEYQRNNALREAAQQVVTRATGDAASTAAPVAEAEETDEIIPAPSVSIRQPLADRTPFDIDAMVPEMRMFGILYNKWCTGELPSRLVILEEMGINLRSYIAQGVVTAAISALKRDITAKPRAGMKEGVSIWRDADGNTIPYPAVRETPVSRLIAAKRGQGAMPYHPSLDKHKPSTSLHDWKRGSPLSRDELKFLTDNDVRTFGDLATFNEEELAEKLLPLNSEAEVEAYLARPDDDAERQKFREAVFAARIVAGIIPKADAAAERTKWFGPAPDKLTAT